MNTILNRFWSRLRTSFWFVPSLFVLLAAIVAWSTLAIDRAWGPDQPWFPKDRVPENGEGIRSLLSTAATAVLTLAGVTFSATLVALTLASSQFGSRILRNFIRSMPNQVAMGVLLGNFVLCLIILHAMNASGFIPRLAAAAAFLATLGSLTTFIYFIHHIAISLQADHIAAEVHDELDQSLERFFPDSRPKDHEERAADEEKLTWEDIANEHVLRARHSGYVQAINLPSLVAVARRRGIRCRVIPRPGQFVTIGDTLLALSEPDAPSDESSDPDDLRKHIILGRFRTPEQDFEFCLLQLVEIALRALSPGINDPFTALICIDYLGAALGKVATRRLPRRTFADDDGVARVDSRPIAFRDLLDAAFHQIRQCAGDRPDIAIRLLGAFAAIGERTMVASQREAVLRHAEAVTRMARAASRTEIDEAAIEEAHTEVLRSLGMDAE